MIIGRAPVGPAPLLGPTHPDSVEVRGGAAEGVVLPLEHGGQVDHGGGMVHLAVWEGGEGERTRERGRGEERDRDRKGERGGGGEDGEGFESCGKKNFLDNRLKLYWSL